MVTIDTIVEGDFNLAFFLLLTVAKKCIGLFVGVWGSQKNVSLLNDPYVLWIMKLKLW